MSDPTWEHFQNPENRRRALHKVTEEQAGDILDLSALWASPEASESCRRCWPRQVVKGAHAIWWRLHRTDRESRLFADLDIDTYDDLCIQARECLQAAGGNHD